MNEITAAIAAAIAPYIPGVIDTITEKVVERMKQMQTEKPKRYFTRQQAAEALSVSLTTIDRMARNGNITPLHLPQIKGTRYDAEEIESKVQSRKGKMYRIKGK